MVADLCSNVLGWRSKLLNTIIFGGLSFELFVRFLCVCVWFVFPTFLDFASGVPHLGLPRGSRCPGCFEGGLEVPS